MDLFPDVLHLDVWKFRTIKPLSQFREDLPIRTYKAGHLAVRKILDPDQILYPALYVGDCTFGLSKACGRKKGVNLKGRVIYIL